MENVFMGAGLCGAALGALLSLKGRTASSLFKSSMTSATSLSMLSVSFSGAQEYTKALTCTDTPVNSAVGGAAAGTLLFISHGGNPVLGAGIVAAMGYTIDLLVRQLGAGVEHDSGRAAESEDSDDDQGKGFFDMNRLLRKTTDEERKAFLEQRRRRILRMDPTQSD